MYHRFTMSDVSRDDSSSSLPQASEARRRLLRGSLALPAVLTVSPGAASAALSISCVQPAPALGQEAVPTALSDQTWFRVNVTAMKKIVDDGYLYYRVGGGQSNNWYRISPTDGDVAKLSTAPLSTEFYASTDAAYASSQVPYRVVQLFDTYGNMKGHPKLVGVLESSWASMACYQSIMGA
jgi:hypothetical protein